MDLSGVITRVVGWTAGMFLTIERSGARVPSGPVLVVANHPNALIDPLVIFRIAGRPTRPLAKAPLFDQRFVGTLLRGMGGLPVYRAQDDPQQMHRNEDTFRGAIEALHNGDAVQIYPEGRSHSEPSLAAMRTGAARIALAAEAQADWKLGLRIVPVGLTYEDKHRFRSRVLAVTGEPFDVVQLREMNDRNNAAAVRALTDEIDTRLRHVTVNLAERTDADLIDTAERLYVREKAAAGWRERERLAERVPRLRAFADGVGWLRTNDPARYHRLARTVSRYRRRAMLLGVHDGDVPPAYPVTATLRYVLVHGTVLVLLAPAALIGTFIWYATYQAPFLTLRLVRPEIESVATYKLATGYIMVPITITFGIAIGAAVEGVRGALVAALLVPVTGFAALAWHERWRRVAEDTLLFMRLLPRRTHQARLARERARLSAEFDELLEITAPARIPVAPDPPGS